MEPPVWLYDTTLRDGTQGENINFSSAEKLQIAKRLEDAGIHYIEGGWPGSNPRDMHFFELVRRETFAKARIVAFGATRRSGIRPEADVNLKALIDSEAPAVALFGKSWDLHVDRVMGIARDENLAMIRESVAFLKGRGRETLYDAEHFFDGFRDNPDYALQTLAAAAEGGADALVLCDTNGGSLPSDIRGAVAAVKRFFENRSPVRLGIHTHNDCGLAVANTIEAVDAGATLVQGTINGYGERCGNADLTSIIPILCLKMSLPAVSDTNLRKIKKLSRFVSETANLVPQSNRPFVGQSAFAHKGGIHVHAIMKEPRAYEHTDPERVGNRRRVLVSDMSGRSNVAYKARELGIDLDVEGDQSNRLVTRIKEMEQAGYQFDAADGSLKILMEKFTRRFTPHFELEAFRVAIEKDQDRPCGAHATIKIKVGGQEEITAAEGQGPVSALDNALRKALDKFYPEVRTMRLVDFKVRVIDGREGTAARVRVLIESRDQDDVWQTIG
ncbi:MAG: citramalate synthase, partial [Desulfobacteraceae bacterium]|nr:citramalate synthase [Desulfobacteraceae bacterium]